MRGPDFIFEHVNARYYELVGHRELIGKTLAEALPEVKEQSFPELLTQVLLTGKPFIGTEYSVLLQRISGGQNSGTEAFTLDRLNKLIGNPLK